jgi:hypothetical protein
VRMPLIKVLPSISEVNSMSLEHSPTRQRKGPASATGGSLERLWTREEIAARYRVTPTWVTRNWGKLGLRPMRVGKRQLTPESQLEAADRRALRISESE